MAIQFHRYVSVDGTLKHSFLRRYSRAAYSTLKFTFIEKKVEKKEAVR